MGETLLKHGKFTEFICSLKVDIETQKNKFPRKHFFFYKSFMWKHLGILEIFWQYY